MEVLSAPAKVAVDITDRCNLECSHCRSRFRGRPAQQLSFSALTKIMDDLASMRVFRLGLSGGEPFLRDDLTAIVEHGICRGLPRIAISTNGTLLSEGRLAGLHRFREQITFKISIDGPRGIHDEVRGVAGAFDAAGDAVRLLHALGFECYVTTTLMKSTAPYLRETLRLVAATGCSRHYVVEVIPRGRATTDMVLSPAARHKAVEAIRAETARTDAGSHAIIAKIPFFDGNRFGFECSAGISECGILSDGLIVGCRLLPEIDEGYVQDSPLSATWRSDEGFAHFRTALPGVLGPPCQDCPDLAACRGGCRAFATRDREGGEGPDLRCPNVGESPAAAVRD